MVTISLSISQTFEMFLLRILYLKLYAILIGLFVLLMSSFLSSLCISDIRPLSDVELVKITLPGCRLLICPINSVLCLKDAFQFHEVPFINCCS